MLEYVWQFVWHFCKTFLCSCECTHHSSSVFDDFFASTKIPHHCEFTWKWRKIWRCFEVDSIARATFSFCSDIRHTFEVRLFTFSALNFFWVVVWGGEWGLFTFKNRQILKDFVTYKKKCYCHFLVHEVVCRLWGQVRNLGILRTENMFFELWIEFLLSLVKNSVPVIKGLGGVSVKPVGSSHKQQDTHLWLIAKNWNSSKLLVEKHAVTVKWEANGD